MRNYIRFFTILFSFRVECVKNDGVRSRGFFYHAGEAVSTAGCDSFSCPFPRSRTSEQIRSVTSIADGFILNPDIKLLWWRTSWLTSLTSIDHIAVDVPQKLLRWWMWQPNPKARYNLTLFPANGNIHSSHFCQGIGTPCHAGTQAIVI